ncbi:uncharacterized protein G2W53_010120 [Senna tora]|uniref:Uncharacterized protein n=1 Tax=Senna tora TaxID=362788 RepID=A0A835CB09_9FABA|nr:uncharacterized protein G2W53_010120 [Senna tora]
MAVLSPGCSFSKHSKAEIIRSGNARRIFIQVLDNREVLFHAVYMLRRLEDFKISNLMVIRRESYRSHCIYPPSFRSLPMAIKGTSDSDAVSSRENLSLNLGLSEFPLSVTTTTTTTTKQEFKVKGAEQKATPR